MRTEKQLTELRFLNIKEVAYPEKNVKSYFFAERLGVDSIAFVCMDMDRKGGAKYLLNNEYKPPVDQFIVGAFGGSLDKSRNPVEIVRDEVHEEAGYVVLTPQVISLGKVLVSTQMNQFCHLFMVMVSDLQFVGRNPENKIEEMANTQFLTYDEVVDSQDWKAITILAKMNKDHIDLGARDG